MRDVAVLAGVSLKTVSRVVNGEGGVTTELENRVRQAIRTLDYQPDDRARALRRSRGNSRSIGFVQTDVTNWFFAAIYRGLEDAARERGLLVLAGSSDADPEREVALIREFIERRVDGLVIASARQDLAFLAAELRHGTPAVFVDLEPAVEMGDVVRTDHYGGAALATNHLLAHGHQRIAFLGDRPVFYSANQRRQAFIDAMEAADHPTPWLITDLTNPREAAAAVHELMASPDPPTALFTSQNYVTIGAVQTLHRLGLQKRVALVGFDDAEFAELLDPALTVIPQHPSELGRLAAERLFTRLDGADEPIRRIVLDCELIPRGSGEIPAR